MYNMNVRFNCAFACLGLEDVPLSTATQCKSMGAKSIAK